MGRVGLGGLWLCLPWAGFGGSPPLLVTPFFSAPPCASVHVWLIMLIWGWSSRPGTSAQAHRLDTCGYPEREGKLRISAELAMSIPILYVVISGEAIIKSGVVLLRYYCGTAAALLRYCYGTATVLLQYCYGTVGVRFGSVWFGSRLPFIAHSITHVQGCVHVCMHVIYNIHTYMPGISMLII